jgi:hypothetical protein
MYNSNQLHFSYYNATVKQPTVRPEKGFNSGTIYFASPNRIPNRTVLLKGFLPALSPVGTR